MTPYLLDTNHIASAIRPVSKLRDDIQRLARAGTRFGTCLPVLCELEAGIQQTRDYRGNSRRLSVLLEKVRIWNIERDVAKFHGSIFIELKQSGRVLSFVDVLLAAVARRHGLTILTSDLDFEALPDISTENWQ